MSGSVDANKFHACMTLFRLADPHEATFATVIQERFGGRAHRQTLWKLGMAGLSDAEWKRGNFGTEPRGNTGPGTGSTPTDQPTTTATDDGGVGVDDGAGGGGTDGAGGHDDDGHDEDEPTPHVPVHGG